MTSADPMPALAHTGLCVSGNRLQDARLAFVALPGDTLELTSEGRYAWSFGSGSPLTAEGSSVAWTAPRSHGITRLTLSDSSSVTQYTIIIPVEGCRWRTTTLNSFPVGLYGDGNTREHLPGQFIELREADRGARVSTHLTLGEFLGHTEGEYPQYIVLDLELVDKLEALVAEAGEHYPEPLDVNVMSGYRTPAYNREIGNETDFSAHLYGKAADIWMEGFPPNNLMDDMDRNKRVDVSDGEFLVEMVRVLEARGTVCVGGASAYRWTPQHGPFVHVDVRGRPATWQTQRNLVTDPVI
jgi:hypothetical protein